MTIRCAAWSSAPPENRAAVDAHDDLVGVLTEAQRLGMIGAAPISVALGHAQAFVTALEALPGGSRVIDLGSGGGLPGLVVASRRSDVSFLLVDRRQKRADFLRRMVQRLGYGHVEVRCDDVATVIREVEFGDDRFDGATARGFGPPEFTLRCASRVVRAGGLVVVSEPPAGDRWPGALLDELGLTSERVGPVRRFVSLEAI